MEYPIQDGAWRGIAFEVESEEGWEQWEDKRK